MTAVDARELNWRFVVPDEPEGLLVLDRAAAGRDRRVTDALDGPPRPAIVVPDVSIWSGSRSPRRVLREVAGAVAPDGWLCVGFPNPWFPGARTGAVGLAAATATLRAAGLVPTDVYLPLPDHRRPALLVDARHPGQLDYVFRHVFLSYVPGASVWSRLVRRLLVGVRRAAVGVPHRLRARLAPAYVVIARRPS